MICKDCGNEYSTSLKMCPDCGTPNDEYIKIQTTTEKAYQQIKDNDRSSVFFNFLSFLSPLIGIIFYFMFKENTPKKAKGCLKTAISVLAIDVVLLAIASIIINFYL